ncbi:DUF6916 family protein [Humibacillus xanthopallidus]|uniref:DUF6916 domain-containing protein n=1 Tax=Humibacillus xanthopallidus TaxID=412689 RepID=A0A543H8D7_9MICO|nr:hypothetical protein [Humibacillus xanthopallidus]TQM54614.1 hypothetical protein FBY41_4652 [Humibacillus xanthopallidus]
MTLDLATAAAADFTPHLETPFTASMPAGDDFRLTLVDVCRGAGGPTREQFTLTFAGGPNPPVRQRILRLDHESLGGLDLFLVPIGPGVDGRQRYEAVFA